MKNVAFTLVMLPPHTSVRRNWAARVAQDEIGVRVLQRLRRSNTQFATSPRRTLRSVPCRPKCCVRLVACVGCRPRK